MTVAENPGLVALADLRTWTQQHCYDHEPIRQTAYGLALSAQIHRLIKYGPDRSLDHLLSRDLLSLIAYVGGYTAEWLMRAAFTRALIEGDSEVTEYLASTPFMPEVRRWYHQLVKGLINYHDHVADHTAWLDTLTGEPLAIARLWTMRMHPDTGCLHWLHDAPDQPQLQAALCAVLLVAKPAYQGALDAWIRDHPLVRNWLL